MENKLEVIYTKDMLDYEINVYGTEEEPLFLVRDIIEWLEYKDQKYSSTKILELCDNSEKTKSKISMSGCVRDMWFVTEDGFYEICMRSNTDKAKKVRKFIKGILKELRTNGYVGTVNQDLQTMTIMTQLLKPMQDMVDSMKRTMEDNSNKTDNKINGIENSISTIRIDHYELRNITLTVKERRDRHRKYFETMAKHYDVSYGRISAVYDYMIYSYMYKHIGRERLTPFENKSKHMGQSLKDITKKEFPMAIAALENFKLDKIEFETRCHRNYNKYLR